jgi:dTDP-4-amino-4,6-dideoxygalactose transaminase
MIVPFVDLKTQYLSIKQEIDSAIQAVLDTTAFVLGENVKKFEMNFAEYCGTKYCVGVGSGTDALYFALLTCGVSAGDEVILPVNTFIATAEAVSYCNAKPVFIDIDEKTYNIDVNMIEEKISSRTKAIIPVHLYGQPANMDAILKIARKYNLKVIEDACQAHGAEILLENNRWERAGSIGDVGCFSFYPGKNLGSYGDGGAVVTNDPEIAHRIQLLRNHGSDTRYVHEIVGYCNRLDSLQAAVLNVKLKKLESWNQKRRENASLYKTLLEGFNITLPYTDANIKPVYHLYVVRVKDREGLQEYLNAQGIDTGIHYPVPLHLQMAYKQLGYNKGACPIAEKTSNEILSLPMYPELSSSQIQYTANKIKEFYLDNQ